MANEIPLGEGAKGQLFVGDLEDAVRFQKGVFVLCVLEQKPAQEPEHAHWIPFLETKQNSATYPQTFSLDIRANINQLEMIAVVIDAALNEGKTVLVHCAQGIERAPLAAAYYLYTKKDKKWEEAYTIVQKARPQCQRRDVWVAGATL